MENSSRISRRLSGTCIRGLAAEAAAAAAAAAGDGLLAEERADWDIAVGCAKSRGGGEAE